MMYFDQAVSVYLNMEMFCGCPKILKVIFIFKLYPMKSYYVHFADAPTFVWNEWV